MFRGRHRRFYGSGCQNYLLPRTDITHSIRKVKLCDPLGMLVIRSLIGGRTIRTSIR